MRPLSVNKLNIVISWLHSSQTTCQISSSTGVSIGTISKIHFEYCSDLPKSSGSCPVKHSLANIHHVVNLITSGKQYKYQSTSTLPPTSLSLPRQCVDNSGELVWKGVGEGLSNRLVEGTVKFGGGSVMLWGCMLWCKESDALHSMHYLQCIPL